MSRVVKTPWIGVTLELGLAEVPVVEAVDVVVLGDQVVGVVCFCAGDAEPIDITAETAGVGAEAVALGVGGDVPDDGALGAEGDYHASLLSAVYQNRVS